jgi:hypothetical protein
MKSTTGATMIKMMIACALLVLAFAGPDAAAQNQEQPGRPDRPEMRERVERMERLKQMRLIEDLQLGEEEAVRFMAKRKEHEDRLRDLADERNSILDELGDELGTARRDRSDTRSGSRSAGKPDANTAANPDVKPDLQAVEKNLARVLEQDRKIFDERKRYQDDMRKMLDSEKFARMLLFERDFQMQIRDAMGRGKNMNRRSQKFDE